MKTLDYLPALLVFLSAGMLTSGCSEIDDYFSTVVAEALFVGVDNPAAAEALGLGPELAVGATATAFLARARSLDSVAENLFSDADSVSISDGITSVGLPSSGNGLYTVTSADNSDLAYVIGRSYALEVYDDGRLYSAEMLAPPPPTLSGIPDAEADLTHAANTALEVSLGQQYDNYLAVVVNDGGEITYSNEPEGASAYLDWIGGSDVFTSITIPGTAFPAAGAVYVIGVAGVRRAPDSAFDNFNPFVSNLAMGSVAVAPLVTAP